MSEVLQIYDGEFGCPTAPEASGAFHQVIVDRLNDQGRAAGWGGARFHSYWKQGDKVCIGIAEGDGWPGLDELRAAMAEIRIRPELQLVASQDDDGQGRMFS